MKTDLCYNTTDLCFLKRYTALLLTTHYCFHITHYKNLFIVLKEVFCLDLEKWPEFVELLECESAGNGHQWLCNGCAYWN